MQELNIKNPKVPLLTMVKPSISIAWEWECVRRGIESFPGNIILNSLLPVPFAGLLPATPLRFAYPDTLGVSVYCLHIFLGMLLPSIQNGGCVSYSAQM